MDAGGRRRRGSGGGGELREEGAAATVAMRREWWVVEEVGAEGTSREASASFQLSQDPLRVVGDGAGEQWDR